MSEKPFIGATDWPPVDWAERLEQARSDLDDALEALERIENVGWPTDDWGARQREAWDAALTVSEIARSTLDRLRGES